MRDLQGPLHGGELNAAVTSALVGIHNKHLGRGATTASTFYNGNVIVTLMREVMTPVERALARSAGDEAVLHVRRQLREALRADYTQAVERLTGKTVVAFISGNHIEPDVAAEVFVLDSPFEPA